MRRERYDDMQRPHKAAEDSMWSIMRMTFMIALSSIAGCTDANTGLFIAGNVKAEFDDDVCTLNADGDQQVTGRYNVDFPDSYTVFPLYNNQLRSTQRDLTADSNGVYVRGVEVEINDAGGSPFSFGGLPNPFSLPTSTFVPASEDGDTPGRAVGSLVIIPELYRAELEGAADGTIIVVNVKPYGETIAGQEIDGTEWQWVVELCDETCTFVCPGDDDDLGACDFGQDDNQLHPCGCGVSSAGCAIGGS